MKKKDFREFVFRATGRTTDIENLTPIDIYDNLVVELDRLKAVGELMSSSNGEIEIAAILGLSEVIRDIEERMREVLRQSMRKMNG
jgi:hypothetical protein